MVRALLDGRKTQTRRIMKVQPPRQEDFPHSPIGIGRAVADGVKLVSLNDYDRVPKHPTKWDLDGAVGVARNAGFPMQYDARFAVGDRLWVKETWTHTGTGVWKIGDIHHALDGKVIYRATNDLPGAGWFPSIFMFRKLSRITLFVTDVRVQRLQDCSEADAMAEGIERYGRFYGMPDTDWDAAELTAVGAYHHLWNSINGAGAWEANPWVVAVSFDVKEGNIDG
ncbi:hypothetical protein ACWGM0_10780 [Sphingomonas bisphenolicum]